MTNNKDQLNMLKEIGIYDILIETMMDMGEMARATCDIFNGSCEKVGKDTNNVGFDDLHFTRRHCDDPNIIDTTYREVEEENNE